MKTPIDTPRRKTLNWLAVLAACCLTLPLVSQLDATSPEPEESFCRKAARWLVVGLAASAAASNAKTNKPYESGLITTQPTCSAGMKSYYQASTTHSDGLHPSYSCSEVGGDDVKSLRTDMNRCNRLMKQYLTAAPDEARGVQEEITGILDQIRKADCSYLRPEVTLLELLHKDICKKISANLPQDLILVTKEFRELSKDATTSTRYYSSINSQPSHWKQYTYLAPKDKEADPRQDPFFKFHKKTQ